MYQLSDIFIGTAPVTQNFGDRPDIYQARFGIRAHNGTDWGLPNLTPLIAGADGYVMERGFDAGGYGNYVKIVHDGFLTLYAHLNDFNVSLKQRVVAGQLIGHSGRTGFADGYHLHFGVAPCDPNGNKTEKNNPATISGYIDPRGQRVQWTIKNPHAPVTPSVNEKPPVQVPFDDYPKIIAEGTNWVTIGNFAAQNGINEYLQANNIGMLDMQNNKSDPDGGKKVVNYMTYLMDRIDDLESSVPQQNAPLTEMQRQSLFEGLKKAVHDFIYVTH